MPKLPKRNHYKYPESLCHRGSFIFSFSLSPDGIYEVTVCDEKHTIIIKDGKGKCEVCGEFDNNLRYMFHKFICLKDADWKLRMIYDDDQNQFKWGIKGILESFSTMDRRIEEESMEVVKESKMVYDRSRKFMDEIKRKLLS